MPLALRATVVIIFGFLTSAFAAILVLFVGNRIGINIFGFTAWFVLPIGALVTGLIAVSGFVAGCWLFNVRPASITLIFMLLAAATTQ